MLDIHTDFIEPPELVRDRILYAVEVFGDPARIQVTPDCGLRTRSWDVAHRKLVNMVEGNRMAKEALEAEGEGRTLGRKPRSSPPVRSVSSLPRPAGEHQPASNRARQDNRS